MKITFEREHQDSVIKFTQEDLLKIVDTVFPHDVTQREELKQVIRDELLNDDAAKMMVTSDI